jgi:hypothetical protein
LTKGNIIAALGSTCDTDDGITSAMMAQWSYVSTMHFSRISFLSISKHVAVAQWRVCTNYAPAVAYCRCYELWGLRRIL